MSALLARPGVAEKVTESGVRYVVWLDGSTRKTDGGGSLACGAAPGGAGCIGFGWWQKESAYEATIWDLKQAKSAGSVGTNVTGTSAIVGAIVPLPFIARVQATACNRMSNQLRSFFYGNRRAARRNPLTKPRGGSHAHSKSSCALSLRQRLLAARRPALAAAAVPSGSRWRRWRRWRCAWRRNAGGGPAAAVDARRRRRRMPGGGPSGMPGGSRHARRNAGWHAGCRARRRIASVDCPDCPVNRASRRESAAVRAAPGDPPAGR